MKYSTMYIIDWITNFSQILVNVSGEVFGIFFKDIDSLLTDFGRFFVPWSPYQFDIPYIGNISLFDVGFTLLPVLLGWILMKKFIL